MGLKLVQQQLKVPLEVYIGLSVEGVEEIAFNADFNTALRDLLTQQETESVIAGAFLSSNGSII